MTICCPNLLRNSPSPVTTHAGRRTHRSPLASGARSDLVLYYGDQSHHDRIIVLGHMHDNAAQRIANMHGTITATVTILGN